MATDRVLTFVVAGDYPTTRKALKALLEGNGFRVLGEASNSDEAVCIASELKPDMAVLDVSLPVPNGLEAARSIKINHSHIKVIILTGYATGPHLLQSLAVGASAYIATNKAASCLLDGIHAVNAGDIYVRVASNDYLNTIARPARESLQDLIVKAQRVLEARNGTEAIVKLSRREAEVLDGVLRALANKEIAFELNLTERTVKFHVSRLLAKFKVRSRMDLISEGSLQVVKPLPKAVGVPINN
jgi:DNA-binding NarL/FixJ family response regulator